MRRDELWRQQYRSQRYLDHLNNNELQQRIKDVLLNLLVLTEEAKIGLPPIDTDSMRWMEIWTHVLDEMCLRFGSYPAGFENGFMKDFEHPSPRHELSSKAGKSVKNSGFKIGDGLIKFGKYCYLKQTIEKGIIRIAPAASYSDPSLNSAIQDDELEIWVQPHPSSYKAETVDKNTNQKKERLFPLNNKITTKSQTNYYVYCMSLALAPRLFVDFEADACLTITKPVIYVNKLLEAMKDKLPNWISGTGAVSYVDPVKPRKLTPEPLFCKHFRYSYQKEFRLIWLPPRKEKDLPFIEVELGNLENCCKLVYLEET